MTRRLLLRALAGLTAVGASARKLVGKTTNPHAYTISKAEGFPESMKVGDRIILKIAPIDQPPRSMAYLHVEECEGMVNSYVQPLTGMPEQHLFIAHRECKVTGLHIVSDGVTVPVLWEKRPAPCEAGPA